MADRSQIRDFFTGKTVLVTGATGFLGKLLVEKLLRSTEVAQIYLLVREKKGQTVNQRLNQIADSVIFESVKQQFKTKVKAVSGDCSYRSLSLSPADRSILLKEINIVFHVAATVRFDENLKLAYAINVQGTGEVLRLCAQSRHLEAFVHVSTAYSNCHRDEIDEEFYETADYVKIGAILEKLTKNEADKLTNRIIAPWPNTYTYTKALAENLIREEANGLPVAIFRPAIVISTYEEPLEGWIDNFNGPTGACAAGAAGLLRVFNCDKDSVADIVPADKCVSGMIATAWDIARKHKSHHHGNEQIITNEHHDNGRQDNINIYNYVSSVENPVTWDEYNSLNCMYGAKYPLSKAIWGIHFTTVKDPRLYLLMKIFFHILPAFLIDLFRIFLGYKPMLVPLYGKIHKFADLIAFFATRQWTFRNPNMAALWTDMGECDRQLFPFSMKTVDWLKYFRMCVKGLRVHLLKDNLDTLPVARIRQQRLAVAHQVLVCLLYFLLGNLVWNLVQNFGVYIDPTRLLFMKFDDVQPNNTCNMVC